MTHVPPAAATASWCRSIASISSVMLKATIGFLPVRSRASAVTNDGHWGPLVRNGGVRDLHNVTVEREADGSLHLTMHAKLPGDMTLAKASKSICHTPS